MAESEIKIEVNIDALTIGDLELLDRAGTKELAPRELVGLLDRLVVGGVRHLPLSSMSNVATAIGDAIKHETQGEASAAGS